MKGLFIKDFYVLRKMMLYFAVIIAVFSLLAAALKNVAFICGISFASATSVVFSAMSYDENDGWTAYVIASGINKKYIVLEKYLLGFSYCCICTVLNIIISVITKNIAVLPDIILYSLFYPVIVQALILPVIYKLGVEKGRAAVIIVLCLAIMLYIFLSTALTASSIPVFAAAFIAAAAAGAVSFNISLTILKKQEF